MRLYLLQVEMFDCEDTNLDVCSNVYSSFEHAKEEGIEELKSNIELIEAKKINYEFVITEISDLEYAENFNIKNKKDEEYYKLEPTHKIYELDYNGNIICMFYEYRNKNALCKKETSIQVYPEDLKEGASEKFKIGDIVKLKNNTEYHYLDDNTDRIYVVRYLPRKFNGEKYFENTYALISLYDLKENKWGNKELFTFEYLEKDIEKYTGEIKENSEYDLLSRIIKGNLKVRHEYWNNIKIGKFPLNLKSLIDENGEDTDDWGFFVTCIPSTITGLDIDIYPEKNIFGINIKDYLPKIRIDKNEKNSIETFSITLEDEPKVVIGENDLKKEDFEKVCDFVRKNKELLLKHFNPDEEKFWNDELWDMLEKNGSIKKE